MKITVTTRVHAPIDEVWRAYTTADDVMRWNAASADWHTPRATVDLREGGTFLYRMEARDGSAGFDFAGTFIRVVPERELAYALGDRIVEVRFGPAADGVDVSVTFDGEETHSAEQQRQGWQSILDNFRSYVERS